MDNTILINAIIRFVESYIKENIDYTDLEKTVGLSYRYLREKFRNYTKMPLKQYINARKIANIIFEMETTDKTLLTLATEYGFDAYDTFTRCFKRELCITPNQYKKEHRRTVERKLIGMGTYAPVVADMLTPKLQFPGLQEDSYILYGVPRVEFSNGKCTPFPACLESMLSYIGQREDCSYTWLMAASGAAFRLCWNAGEWDMSNSNIMNVTPQNPWELYERAYQAAGWKCNIIEKNNSTTDILTTHIIDNINKGNPVIALGVVGPPEACIITGYNGNGKGLFGWSYFQDSPEFSADIEIEKSGYFLCSKWWDNPATTALITLGERTAIPSLYEILHHIYSVLTLQSAGVYQAGQNAYQSWANDISDDISFRGNSITPILLSRFFCQADAETMIGEGRHWGAQFFRQLGEKQAHIAGLCFEAAELLTETAGYAQQMTAIRQGDRQTEEALGILCKPETRKGIVSLIKKAQENEKRATTIISSIIDTIH